jgi:lipopolysaccharide/colanic/teichoic acid biosynthesis glycosyltransferase
MVTATASPTLHRTVRRVGRPHVLSEELFSRVLIAERRRADRADHPLVVMVLSAVEPRGGDASSLWRGATEAVAQHTRATDVMGWLGGRTAIGIILHEVHAPDSAYPRALEVRIRRDLATRFDADTVARFAFHLHVHATGTAPSAPDVVAEDEPTPDARQSQSPFYDGLKRLFDIVSSATLLAVLAPVLLLIAVLVKLKSPGPILFRQVRVGRMMKPFRMLKFRTMHVNADHSLHHAFVSQFINAGGQDQPPGTPGFFKLVNDPRITPIGAVLRKTSLDELPQLWNVLRGEMSLVGPRPALPYEVEQYKRWHTRRVFEAKPGITGLWQVGGRSRTTFDDMVRLDLRYARARSLWTDIKILLATPAAVFTGKGAC